MMPPDIQQGYPRSGATARNAMHLVRVVRALVVGNRNGLSQLEPNFHPIFTWMNNCSQRRIHWMNMCHRFEKSPFEGKRQKCGRIVQEKKLAPLIELGGGQVCLNWLLGFELFIHFMFNSFVQLP